MPGQDLVLPRADEDAWWYWNTEEYEEYGNAVALANWMDYWLPGGACDTLHKADWRWHGGRFAGLREDERGLRGRFPQLIRGDCDRGRHRSRWRCDGAHEEGWRGCAASAETGPERRPFDCSPYAEHPVGRGLPADDAQRGLPGPRLGHSRFASDLIHIESHVSHPLSGSAPISRIRPSRSLRLAPTPPRYPVPASDRPGLAHPESAHCEGPGKMPWRHLSDPDRSVD